MRLNLFCLLLMFSLTGCVYYGDIHGNAKPLTPADLTTAHNYKAPMLQMRQANWWNRFHDPQLNQLISVALADTPTMQAAEARIRRAKHLAESSASVLWPSIDFSGYVTREKFATFGLVPPPFNGHTFNIGDAAFNFNYDFDFWGKNRQALAARVNEECAAQADLASARLVISAAVANSYFQLLGSMAQLQVATSNAKLSRQLATIVFDRARNGIESDIPLKTALSDKQTSTLAVAAYRRSVLLSKHQLAALMGKNAFTTKIATPRFAFHLYKVTLPASLPANLLAQRPDIAASRALAQAAAHRINVAKARFFPDINMNALFSYTSVGLGHLFDVGSQNNGVTAAIDLPIFDAGQRRADLGARYAEYDSAVLNYNDTILTALREVADQLSTIQTLKSQISAQDSAVSSTRHNYKLFNSRYNHGIVEYSQVLAIKQLLLQQELTQLNLQLQHLQAVVAMLKALGGNEL